MILIGSCDELWDRIEPLRRAVFLEEQGIPEEEVFDGLEEGALHAALVREDAVLAVARLREETPGVWRINWVAVAPARRGEGLGRTLMRAVLEEIRVRGGTEITLDAQSTAVGFYEKLGFRQNGAEIRFPSGFVLVPMLFRV